MFSASIFRRSTNQPATPNRRACAEQKEILFMSSTTNWRTTTRTSVLAKLMEAFSASEEEFKLENPKYIIFNCRLAAEEEPIKLGVPFRALGEQIEERMSRADVYKDLPRGKKRRGWKKEFLESLTEAARDSGEVSEEEILRTVRSYRKERRAPEITVAAES